jgi:hypothetical protein
MKRPFEALPVGLAGWVMAGLTLARTQGGYLGCIARTASPRWRGRTHTNRRFPDLVSELNPFIRRGRS